MAVRLETMGGEQRWFRSELMPHEAACAEQARHKSEGREAIVDEATTADYEEERRLRDRARDARRASKENARRTLFGGGK